MLRPLLLSATLLLASSCIHAPQPSDSAQAEATAALSQAKACLSSGNYRKSLDIYGSAIDRYPEMKDLSDAYAEALESIREKADRAYESQDYAKAGELYAVLLKSGFGERPMRGRLSFDDEYPAMRVGACSKMLIEQGILKYREDDLQQAIAIWKKVLVFNPIDREAKTAIDRASLQLQNLKQMK